MKEQVNICGKAYSLIKLLRHGKGGYLYLAESGGNQ